MTWEYRKVLVLSGIPVNGCYRFNDSFQILPAKPKAPRPPAVLNHHPFIIEYRFTITETPRQFPDGKDIPQWVINNDDAHKTLKEILLLLTAFSNDRVFTYSHKQSWFIPMGIKGEEPKTREVQWGQEGYTYDGFEVNIESFTEIESKPIELVEADEYFNRKGRHIDQVFDLPGNIDKLISLYLSLVEDEKHVFLSSCSLFSQGIKLWSEHPSLSFAALVSSLEALITIEHKDTKVENCKECHQEKYRVTEKFRDFFSKYGSPSKEFRKYALKIYRYRCRILHRGELFLGEVTPRRFGSLEGFDDDVLRRSIINTCRVCIINWLWNKKQSLTTGST